MNKKSSKKDFSVEKNLVAKIDGKPVEILDHFVDKDGHEGIMVAPHSYFGSNDFGKTWHPMTGVTTILSVIAKPALISWAANTAIAYVKDHLGPNGEVSPVLLEEARVAHTKKKEEAGTKGTDLHAVVEMFAKHEPLTEQQIELINPFIQWSIENKISFLESEKKLYNFDDWIAGTTDLVLEKDGKKFIADIKTSSAIYPEHFFQMAGYRKMLEGKGLENEYFASMVIRMGKDGSFEVQERYDYETDLKAFEGAVALYRAQETFKIK